MAKISAVFLAFLILFGCNPPEEAPNNRFSDQKLQRIYDFQDRQETKKLIPFLKAKKESHREAAVLAFASIQDASAVEFLKVNMFTDTKKSVRKAAAYAIGQLRDSANVPLLFTALENEIDAEVRMYIFEALGKSANQDVINYFNTFNSHVSQLRLGHLKGMYRSILQRKVGDKYASNALQCFDINAGDDIKLFAANILARIPKSYTEPLQEQIESIKSNQTDTEIVRLLNIALPNEETTEKEQVSWADAKEFNASHPESPYQLAEMLGKLSNLNEEEFGELKDWMFNHTYQIVRTTSVGLVFNEMDSNYRKTSNYRQLVIDCLASRDMALNSTVCYDLIQHPDSVYLDFLQRCYDNLVLPRQLETAIDIEKAIAKCSGKEYVKRKLEFGHPIDWNYVQTVKQNERVIIETSKGNIEMELYVNEAPGSVVNFLKLVDEGYYDNKFFHRVVPNFVIQTGCNRGDGWGSLDWLQRSEFSNYLSYKEGSVGLASAGNHTEGVQFFITHNPTLFLDGRYTIFAQVTNGMNVVNKIALGDKIITIKRKNATDGKEDI